MSTKKFSPTLDTLVSFLEKARRRLSDEEPDFADRDEQQEVGLEDTLSEQTEDEADQWLKDNDSKYGDEYDEEAASPNEVESEEKPFYEEKKPVATKPSVSPAVRRKASSAAAEPSEADLVARWQAGKLSLEEMLQAIQSGKVKALPSTPSAPSRPSVQRSVEAADEDQPSREELAELRPYTRVWEQRARDRMRLEANPELNPIKHHEGRIVEARNMAAADYHKAHEEFKASPEYKSANPIARMRMDAKFHADWHAKNPDHLKTALQAHAEAHKKGAVARELFERAKDEKIRHIAGGGIQPSSLSVEEGLQHVGAGREEDDAAPSGITQDRAAQFAQGNQEFLREFMPMYNQRAKKFRTESDLETFDNETRADIGKVLGDDPALKDPETKAKFDAFTERFYPLISKAAGRVVSKLGLSEHMRSGRLDYGLLHYAGLHALYQAVNDYDHDHPSKASFKTHLSRKMQGLMQTALKTQLEEGGVPEAMRNAAKKFDQHKRAVNAAPVKILDPKTGQVLRTVNADGTPYQPKPPQAPAAPPATAAPTIRSSTEIAANHHPDVQDRLKRVQAAKAPLVRRAGSVQPKPQMPRLPKVEDEGGEE